MKFPRTSANAQRPFLPKLRRPMFELPKYDPYAEFQTQRSSR
jgi:hypothetical protein